jgi:ferrous iron transport protein B
MLYMNQGKMVQLEGAVLSSVLTDHGWTVLTAVSLMLFSLMHNPCGTTIWTIWSETKSVRWTVFGALMPLTVAIIACALVANVVRLLSAIGAGPAL